MSVVGYFYSNSEDFIEPGPLCSLGHFVQRAGGLSKSMIRQYKHADKLKNSLAENSAYKNNTFIKTFIIKHGKASQIYKYNIQLGD